MVHKNDLDFFRKPLSLATDIERGPPSSTVRVSYAKGIRKYNPFQVLLVYFLPDNLPDRPTLHRVFKVLWPCSNPRKDGQCCWPFWLWFLLNLLFLPSSPRGFATRNSPDVATLSVFVRSKSRSLSSLRLFSLRLVSLFFHGQKT